MEYLWVRSTLLSKEHTYTCGTIVFRAGPASAYYALSCLQW